MNPLHLLTSDWYTNPTDKECSRVSFANILLLRGMKKLARAVYEQFPQHPLYQQYGATLGVESRMFHELTGLQPCLKADFDKTDFRLWNGFTPETELEEVVRQEMQAGRIEHSNQSPIPYRTPAIVTMLTSGKKGHSMVHAGKLPGGYGVFIDDGQVNVYPKLNVAAAMEIRA